MDEIQEQIDTIEEDTETVKDLYELVDQYQVPVNPEDLAVYQACLLIGKWIIGSSSIALIKSCLPDRLK